MHLAEEFLLPCGIVALNEHENRTAICPRVIWLTGIFCGPRVLGTDVRCELSIALLFVVLHHFDD